MEILPYVYLGYMFIALYLLAFFLILYFKNKREMFEIPELKKQFEISMIVPCYNEEENIGKTIECLLKTDYPYLKKIIVVDDCSTDNSYSIIKSYAKKYPEVIAVRTPKNTGCAGGAKNYGLKFAKTEIIGFSDSDSFPRTDAIRKMMGYFEDEKVGAVTCPVIVKNDKRFFERLQAAEYATIAFTRKLLEMIDAIYVTPGPLALYRRKALLEIKGFDAKNLTEDIEATWHLAAIGWKRKMCLNTEVTTVVPSTFKQWFRQRERWNIGGLQTIMKYKKLFARKNIVGYFILPFFLISTFLGLLGLSIFSYLIASRILREYFFLKFSFMANTAVITLNEFYFTPSVLNYLGVVLFIFGACFTVFTLYTIQKDLLKKDNILNILFYMIVYLSVYPGIMITSMIKMMRKDIKW